MGHDLNLNKKGKLGQKIRFLLLCKHESEKREKEEGQELPSKIYGVLLIEVRKAKNESSSHRRGLHVGTKNVGFAEDPNEELGKSKVSSLGSVHKAS